jgi:hypothetical protein
VRHGVDREELGAEVPLATTPARDDQIGEFASERDDGAVAVIGFEIDAEPVVARQEAERFPQDLQYLARGCLVYDSYLLGEGGTPDRLLGFRPRVDVVGQVGLDPSTQHFPDRQ